MGKMYGQLNNDNVIIYRSSFLNMWLDYYQKYRYYYSNFNPGVHIQNLIRKRTQKKHIFMTNRAVPSTSTTVVTDRNLKTSLAQEMQVLFISTLTYLLSNMSVDIVDL